jgi:hypothetical protein
MTTGRINQVAALDHERLSGAQNEFAQPDRRHKQRRPKPQKVLDRESKRYIEIAL